MILALAVAASLPRALSSYPDQRGYSIVQLLIERVRIEPFNDNALITYLATPVPSLDESLTIAVVEGAVSGILPIGVLLGALIPTLIAALAFGLL